MKRFAISLFALALTVSVFAQTPNKMSYQAVIRNSSNQLVTSHVVGMKISILQGSESGTAVYVETQTPTTNANGLATIEIGAGTPITGTFSGIDWTSGSYFIKTEADPTGNTTYTITGTSQILSVPYALYAKSSSTAIDAVKLSGDQSIAGTKTFTGSINASNKIITNVATPINSFDASNKKYVDSLRQKVQALEDLVSAQLSPTTNGLIAYYPFNGNANDLSGNNLNGTVYNATLTTDRFGNTNSAYYFNQTNAYIEVLDNNLLDFTNKISVCAWFSLDNSSSGGTIVGKARGTNLSGFALMPFIPTLSFGINNGPNNVSPYITSSEYNTGWHFMVGTYDGSQVKLYLDNILVVSANTTISLINSSRNLYIGSEDYLWRLFGGKIDDVRIYNRALTSLEIQNLYHVGGW